MVGGLLLGGLVVLFLTMALGMAGPWGGARFVMKPAAAFQTAVIIVVGFALFARCSGH